MSSTRPESDCGGDTSVTPLAEAIRGDTAEDSRSCPQETCHGSLTVNNEDVVFCSSCRCTPEGVFYPPEPSGSDAVNTSPQSWDHGKYDSTRRVRLAGGYEAVYDEDEENRPHGVDDQYTFDLSTL